MHHCMPCGILNVTNRVCEVHTTELCHMEVGKTLVLSPSTYNRTLLAGTSISSH
jgi:hypothetical protein